MYHNLNEFIDFLEKNNELIRIKEYVSPELQITEIVDRVSKQKDGGKAILFENTGTDFPVLINLFGSLKRICATLHTDNLEDISKNIEKLLKKMMSPPDSFLGKLKLIPEFNKIASWMPRTIKDKAPCQEIIDKSPDLTKLPVLKCWPEDGGAFITLPSVHTYNPETKIRNVGMYRMQVFSENITGMHWHKHKTGANHFRKYKELKKKMPIAVTLGGDPVYTYVATAPLPENIDEYILAGFLRNKRVDLVKCITQDIEVPADVDIVIEGYIDPEEDFIWEGPFGDHTGFYSLADWFPKFHVTCITRQQNAVYPATIVGIPPQEDAYIGAATERIFIMPIKLSILPELTDMNIPVAGVAHNLTIISIEKTYAGQAIKVMNAIWGAGQLMFNKILVVVDKSVDVHNYQEVARTISSHVNPSSDIHFSSGPLDILDHSSSKYAYGTKIGIDATKKIEEEIDETTQNQGFNPYSITLDKEKIQTNYPEITKINDELLKKGISIIILGVEKKDSIKNLIAKLIESNLLIDIKYILITNNAVDLKNLFTSIWFIVGNIDPKRDCIINKNESKTCFSQIFIDGTIKDKENDQFQRDWPNVVVSSEKTIKEIDELWKKLPLGEFIPSPSLQFYDLVKNKGAILKK